MYRKIKQFLSKFFGKKTESQRATILNNASKEEYELILHDNPKISEDSAINAIAYVCGYTPLTCIQLTTLITAKGKCGVKCSSNLDELISMQEEFEVGGLSSSIEIIDANI